jgi:hypothetical protein
MEASLRDQINEEGSVAEGQRRVGGSDMERWCLYEDSPVDPGWKASTRARVR